ncbi:DUF3368 domain-containing protein [Cellvibrio sp. UBA7661]|uniref:DUF3368 domain-containing protein n=1 Tax=Cellvibrio sp. UBA7661 TaxID=1946311 RepID=UPI002F3542FA
MSLSNLTTNQLLVADTSPLLALARVGFLERLPQLFGKIYITQSVLAECMHKPSRSDAQQVQRALDNAWLIPVDDPIVRTSLLTLDRGEQTALEFALQNNAVVLIDEKNGREIAKNHHLKIIGAIGVLLLAKKHHQIPAVKPLLQALLASGYFISEQLINNILELAGEQN